MASGKITCQICGAAVHSIQLHLKKEHPATTIEDYQVDYPDAELLSATAKSKLAKIEKTKKADAAMGDKKSLHEVFDLGEAKAARNARGGGIPITVPEVSEHFRDMIPDKDPNYIFPIDVLKDVLMGMELNIPVMLWGHAGTGKSSMHKQVCAHTQRAYLRVQHTVNTEEVHILGQWQVRDGATFFEYGPLPLAMKHGLVYCADEYDMAMPSVLSVYQPVLEGEPLLIKEAPEDMRMVMPHKDFRFVGTGNTNGCGDETGLYQGTNIGNAANYERFGIMRRVEYMVKKQEVGVVSGQGGIAAADAELLVDYATEVRKAYDGGKIGMTVSPRALINAAKLGLRRGDYKAGLQLSFSNRLTQVDREVVDSFAQRVFG